MNQNQERKVPQSIQRLMADELTYVRQRTFSPSYLAENRESALTRYFDTDHVAAETHAAMLYSEYRKVSQAEEYLQLGAKADDLIGQIQQLPERSDQRNALLSELGQVRRRQSIIAGVVDDERVKRKLVSNDNHREIEAEFARLTGVASHWSPAQQRQAVIDTLCCRWSMTADEVSEIVDEAMKRKVKGIMV